MALALTGQALLAASVFSLTYGGLVLRNRLRTRLPLWLIFLVGALLMMAGGLVTAQQAQSAVDLRVLTFLFSMFVITGGLQLSGDLDRFAAWLVSRSRNEAQLLILISAGFGLAASVLMNDTVALMGTPILVATARRLGMRAKPLLLTLAFAITIGSAMTPIGNPQNMLIAVESGVPAPFLTYLFFLLPSTLINIGVLAGFMYFAYRRELRLHSPPIFGSDVAFDAQLSRLSRAALALAVGGMVLVNLLSLVGVSYDIGISELTLLAATFLLLVSGRRNEVLAKVDWGVLVMFAALFVFTRGVYNGGLLNLLNPLFSSLGGMGLLAVVILTSVLLSQVVSNVPLVTLMMPLYLNLIPPSSPAYWAAFAGSSTLAGNVTLLGAASNLIIVEEADKDGEQLTYGEFLKVGLPLSVINIGVLFLTLVPYTG